MADLRSATTVERVGDGRFAATLDPNWEVWGPQGGYLASVGLRAAAAHMDRARPASLNVHFVGAGASGPVIVEVETNRATRVGTSVSIRIVQPPLDGSEGARSEGAGSEGAGRVLLTGSVWGVDADLPGLEHQVAGSPLDPMSPDGLLSMAERMAGRDDGPPHPFWHNIESRPTQWIENWDDREPAEPHDLHWYRFVDGETFDDPWVDACRSVVVLDLDAWGSALRPHVGDLAHFAPTIELAVRFIGDARSAPWLLSEAQSPRANDGLIAHTGAVWIPSGEIVATGGSTLLCRPAAGRPDGR